MGQARKTSSREPREAGKRPLRGYTNSGRYSQLDADKLRGGYYTSERVARWLCAWAIAGKGDRVLEPSCGDGAFVECAAQRLSYLGATRARVSGQVVAVEVIATEGRKAVERLNKLGISVGANTIAIADFFEWFEGRGKKAFDCVVGNPPFIRYQSFPEPARSRAMRIMEQLGLVPNRLTNIWVPFVAAAVACLGPGGRLGMVLPAELLQVSYASQLRSFLADRFERIEIVACNDLFFEDAEQEVVLLLASGALAEPSSSNPCRIDLFAADTVAEVVARNPTVGRATGPAKIVRHDSEKWLKYFLSSSEIGLMRRLRESPTVAPLSVHASVDVGVVTGKNEFFVLTDKSANEHRLREYTLPLIGRASHLRGAVVTRSEWRKLSGDGERVHLFYVDPKVNGTLSSAGRRYVVMGEEKDFDKGYKCSVRSPWYSVPSVWSPDCFFFRQIYDFPRVVVNECKATSTDTIHRLTCSGPRELVATNLYTHLTAASAEIEGRSYGGGVLELEPTEAERLLMPAKLWRGLSVEESDRLIRAGRLEEVLNENDRRVLIDGVGLSKRECSALRGIWEKMRNRRMCRRRNGDKFTASASETPHDAGERAFR